MSVKGSIAWMGLTQVFVISVQFVSSVVISWYLTPHELGIYAVGIATVAMLSILQSFGFQPLLVREPVLTESLEDTVNTANLLLASLLTVIIFCSAIIVPFFFSEVELRRVLMVLCFIPLIGVPSFLPGALMEREARFKELALITSVSGIFTACISVILVVFHFGVISLAYANVAGTIFMVTSLIIRGRSHFRVRISAAEWRRVTSFGTQIFAASSLVTLSPRIGEILLGRLLGLSSLGLYNRANGLSNMLWGAIHPIIARVILVDFATCYRNTGDLRRKYITAVISLCGILWPAFLSLAAIASVFINTVYGEEWRGAIQILVYLSISSIVLTLSAVAWEVCTVTDNVGIQIKIESVRVLVSLGLLAIASLISLEAIAFSRIVEAAIAFFLYRPYLSRMTNTRMRDFYLGYLKSAVLALFTATPVFAITHLSIMPASPVILMIMSVIAGCASWCIMVFVLRHPLAYELQTAIRTARSVISNKSAKFTL